MQDLSMHILDVAENSIRAGARTVLIRLTEHTPDDLLLLEITDDGAGMDQRLCARAMSPFETSRSGRRFGLGLALLKQAALDTGGDCLVTSAPQQGTRVLASFQHSHIDRKPLGNLAETMVALGVGSPDINFVLEVCRDGDRRRLETKQLSAQLGDVSLSDPAGLRTLRARLSELLAEAPLHEIDSISAETGIDQGV